MSSRTASPRKSGRAATKRTSLSRLNEAILSKQRNALRDSVQKVLPASVTRDEFEAHLNHMPLRYWGSVTTTDVVWHLQALNTFFKNLVYDQTEAVAPVICWRHFPRSRYSEALVCTWNRHGLFAKVAGSFAMNGMNILQADIHTRTDHLILDLFRVCDEDNHCITSKARIQNVAKWLGKSLEGMQDVPFSDILKKEDSRSSRRPKRRVTKPAIEFDNGSLHDHTILRIHTPDRIGLLYDILQILTLNGVDIAQAKIQTREHTATDEFQITDKRGLKITDLSRLDTIRDLLLEMIARGVEE